VEPWRELPTGATEDDEERAALLKRIRDRQAALSRARLRRVEEAYRAAVKTPEGRTLLAFLIQDVCRIYHHAGSGEAARQAEGRRAVGLEIRKTLMDLDPRLPATIEAEFALEPEAVEEGHG